MFGQIEYYRIGEPQIIKYTFRYDGHSGTKCLSTYHIKRVNGVILKVLVTTWSMDEQVELDVFKVNNKEEVRLFSLKSLTHNKFKKTSRIRLYFDVEKHFFKEHYGWLIQTFTSNGIKLLKKKNDETVFYAEHNNGSERQIFNIIEANLVIKEFSIVQKPVEQFTSKSSSNVFIYLFIILFLSGCFTLVTRQKAGCKCRDGSESSAISSGACSHHHGVLFWRYEYWWDK